MISLDISIDDQRWEDLDLETISHSVADALLAEKPAALSAGEVVLLFTSDEDVHALNREWRGKDKPTNVLSFPADDFPVPDGMPKPLGDIALAYETCCREAGEKQITVQNHLSHLILHGILHLLGYDHILDEDAEEMERLETAILYRLGIADPYGPDMNGERDA